MLDRVLSCLLGREISFGQNSLGPRRISTAFQLYKTFLRVETREICRRREPLL